MARAFFDHDADLSILDGRTIGILGYGNQGRPQALNLRDSGLRVSVIKHAHHTFDFDVPGKDSWRHREAGAEEVLVSSGHPWALLSEPGREGAGVGQVGVDRGRRAVPGTQVTLPRRQQVDLHPAILPLLSAADAV